MGSAWYEDSVVEAEVGTEDIIPLSVPGTYTPYTSEGFPCGH